ncbi:MAG: hypothetical protein K8U57_27440 [Planctomycetes bacterium]|nr:hypothetical protein [Planctomycetota bacterium]
MSRLVLVGLAALLAGPAACAAVDELAGRWVYKTELLTVTTVFLADGRYFAEIKVGDNPVPQRGRYSIKGGKVTIEPQGEPTVVYPYVYADDTLEITTPELGKMTYRRVNTAKEIAAEAAKADAAKAKEDDEWRAKFEVTVMTKQPPHVAVGDVPADKNVEKVFDKPTVFAKQQLYLHNGLTEFVYANGNPPGKFKTYFNWHFLPTGRVYVDATTYTGAVALPKNQQGPWGTYYVSGKTETKKFGRYKVGKDEALIIEMDDGEMVEAKFIDGRRNMVWGKSTYGNVVWELEALKRLEK